MNLERKISSSFKMDEKTWNRHSNPWSVVTRVTVTPILVLSLWSRVIFGWYSIILVIFGLIWMYVNPRVFSPPKSTNNWASKGVFGERVWVNRDKVPIPEKHRIVPNILSIISGIGFIFILFGTYKLDILIVLFGFSLNLLGKLWFVDRMVWLYEDMKHLPEYEKFEY
mgnify:FL=1